eukprot:CAMPEP_0115756698 /NCGR_PEP_ID=MMETSP0272-20121206/98056_1 /TAXON_ID=71861 /ORGANISM="Scrippsiella trochoidea, Strain CCMP3099" /LENGTH=163 /DNA_ID=CAMNT_0003202217 /DNA_START=316 /DNA_END=804 /DNA_ORIENTATION=-
MESPSPHMPCCLGRQQPTEAPPTPGQQAASVASALARAMPTPCLPVAKSLCCHCQTHPLRHMLLPSLAHRIAADVLPNEANSPDASHVEELELPPHACQHRRVPRRLVRLAAGSLHVHLLELRPQTSGSRNFLVSDEARLAVPQGPRCVGAPQHCARTCSASW